MEPGDPKLFAAQTAALDAIAHWAKNDTGYFSMKDKLENYWKMEAKMIGWTEPEDIKRMRQSSVPLLMYGLIYPSYRLTDYHMQKARSELNTMAEDMPLKQSRGRHH